MFVSSGNHSLRLVSLQTRTLQFVYARCARFESHASKAEASVFKIH